MRSTEVKPALKTHRPGELILSGEDFLGIMRSVLEKGIPFRFMAGGSSMVPFIRNGDIVTIHPCRGTSLQEGDVVAFISPASGKLSVHRIVRKGRESYAIKGDNLTEMNGTISPGRILGTVIRVERNGKAISFGTGPGRPLITGLSRSRFFFPALTRTAKSLRSFFRRMEK